MATALYYVRWIGSIRSSTNIWRKHSQTAEETMTSNKQCQTSHHTMTVTKRYIRFNILTAADTVLTHKHWTRNITTVDVRKNPDASEIQMRWSNVLEISHPHYFSCGPWLSLLQITSFSGPLWPIQAVCLLQLPVMQAVKMILTTVKYFRIIWSHRSIPWHHFRDELFQLNTKIIHNIVHVVRNMLRQTFAETSY